MTSQPFDEELDGVLLVEVGSALEDGAVLASSRFPGVDRGAELARIRNITWAQAHSAEMVTAMNATSREALRQTIIRGLEENLTAQQLARRIRHMIGLDARRAAQVDVLYATLRQAGESEDKIEQAVEKLTQALIRDRAETIGRTELIAAANHGQEAWWQQALQESILPQGSMHAWLHADDVRVDDEGVSGPCIDNQNAGPIPLGEPFPSGHITAPAHPNCRCTTYYVPPEDFPGVNEAMAGNYDPNQPRDEIGRWTDTGAASGRTEVAQLLHDPEWRAKEIERRMDELAGTVDEDSPQELKDEYRRVRQEWRDALDEVKFSARAQYEISSEWTRTFEGCNRFQDAAELVAFGEIPETPHEVGAAAMIAAINEGDEYEVLYRGLHSVDPSDFQSGQVIDIPLASTSEKRKVAEEFAMPERHGIIGGPFREGVVLEVTGASGWPPFGANKYGEQVEVVVSGRFEVTEVDVPNRTVYIRQVDKFETPQVSEEAILSAWPASGRH